MARVFNAREGFSRKDDCLPERLFQPLENGALAGQSMQHEDFERALTTALWFEGLGSGDNHSKPQAVGGAFTGLGSGFVGSF